jgi:lysophospholipase L1-like esterase
MSSVAKALLIAVLSISSGLAQSISIVRSADENFWVQAINPASDPYTLQISENLHLWIDVTGDLSTQYAAPLTNLETRFYQIKPTPPEPDPIRVVLLGDSMVSDCCGWGQGMPRFFKQSAQIINYSQPWTSTKAFLQSAEYDKMLLVKPKYVVLQFGYSDGGPDPDRHSTAEEFAENLRTIGHVVQGFNGTPIYVTLHADRTWDSQGKLIPSEHPYNAINKQVAAELNAPVIDLYPTSYALFSKLGKDGCAFMHWVFGEPDDGLHFSPMGAIYVSQLIVRSLPDEFGPYLNGVFEPLPQP